MNSTQRPAMQPARAYVRGWRLGLTLALLIPAAVAGERVEGRSVYGWPHQALLRLPPPPPSPPLAAAHMRPSLPPVQGANNKMPLERTHRE